MSFIFGFENFKIVFLITILTFWGSVLLNLLIRGLHIYNIDFWNFRESF